MNLILIVSQRKFGLVLSMFFENFSNSVPTFFSEDDEVLEVLELLTVLIRLKFFHYWLKFLPKYLNETFALLAYE